MANKKLSSSAKILLPAKGETAAISTKAKTAALCYDRVWCPSENVFQFGEKFPESIRFFGGTNVESTLSFDIEGKSIKTFPSVKRLLESEDGRRILDRSTLGLMSDILYGKSKEKARARLEEATKVPVQERQKFIDNTNFITDLVYRDIARSFSAQYQIPVATVCDSCKNQEAMYYGGNRQAMIACIKDLRIVDENQLRWEQVLEFRRDQGIQAKYKRFLHWLDKELVGKSQAFVEDEIAIRLEDYEQALKKHGIKTILGTIQEALDGKYLLGAGALTLAGHPALGAGLIIGKVLVKLAQTKLDFDDVERGPNSEISWVYEAKKLG